MKFLLYILIPLLFLLSSCSSQKELNNTNTGKETDQIVIKNDELEYEIIIFEPGFNNWLATQPPKSFFTQGVLEMKNKRWVSEWNRRVLQPTIYPSNLYEMRIDYENHINYGIEVNYTLYMYFKYFQQKYNQRL